MRFEQLGAKTLRAETMNANEIDNDKWSLIFLTILHFQQASGLSTTLSDLKVALQDLSTELREERQSSQELTQQFARAKASWEVERTELKSLITQVQV